MEQRCLTIIICHLEKIDKAPGDRRFVQVGLFSCQITQTGGGGGSVLVDELSRMNDWKAFTTINSWKNSRCNFS